MKYKIIKFRIYNSRDRQGFVFIFNNIPPEVVLEDLLFQLFHPLFQKIKSPEIYYLTESEEILSYRDIINQQRELQTDIVSKQTKPFFLFDIEKIARGLDKRTGNLLYIFSEKQYIAYRNKTFAEIIKNRIEDLNKATLQRKISNNTFVKSIQTLMNDDDINEMRRQLEQQKRLLDRRNIMMAELTDTLMKVKNEVQGSLNLLGVRLTPLFNIS